MSKLNDLIKEMCPNGVNFYKIKEISSVTIGEFVHKNKQSDDGQYPVYNGGTSNTGFYDEYNNDGHKVIISARGANAGFINRVKGKYWAGNSCYTININDESKLDWNYLYQYLKNNQSTLLGVQQTGSIPAISKKQVEEFKIAIPPLEVQEEVVRILDKFGELEAELEAELETRESQYEFWRSNIFDNINSKVKTIKELCTDVIVPMRDKPKVFDGTIPWCRIDDKDGNYFNTSKSGQFVSEETIKKMNLKVFPTGTVICSCSASIGSYAINTQPLITNQTFIGLVCGDEIINKYLFYYMQTQTNHLLELSNSGTIPYISRKKFEDLEVPLPPIEEQKRIVNILDKFDKLTNDITIGIPAEIELRRKQYEYYRNKLLSFEELSVDE